MLYIRRTYTAYIILPTSKAANTTFPKPIHLNYRTCIVFHADFEFDGPRAQTFPSTFLLKKTINGQLMKTPKSSL